MRPVAERLERRVDSTVFPSRYQCHRELSINPLVYRNNNERPLKAKNLPPRLPRVPARAPQYVGTQGRWLVEFGNLPKTGGVAEAEVQALHPSAECHKDEIAKVASLEAQVIALVKQLEGYQRYKHKFDEELRKREKNVTKAEKSQERTKVRGFLDQLEDVIALEYKVKQLERKLKVANKRAKEWQQKHEVLEEQFRQLKAAGAEQERALAVVGSQLKDMQSAKKNLVAAITPCLKRLESSERIAMSLMSRQAGQGMAATAEELEDEDTQAARDNVVAAMIPCLKPLESSEGVAVSMMSRQAGQGMAATAEELEDDTQAARDKELHVTAKVGCHTGSPDLKDKLKTFFWNRSPHVHVRITPLVKKEDTERAQQEGEDMPMTEGGQARMCAKEDHPINRETHEEGTFRAIRKLKKKLKSFLPHGFRPESLSV